MVWYDHTDGWISRQSKITPVRNASALDGSVRGSGIYSFDVWIVAGITDGGFRYIKGNDGSGLSSSSSKAYFARSGKYINWSFRCGLYVVTGYDGSSVAGNGEGFRCCYETMDIGIQIYLQLIDILVDMLHLVLVRAEQLEFTVVIKAGQ